ncbi:MAG: hypothetical protein AAGB35_04255 [Pseudomonadota bacterium]
MENLSSILSGEFRINKRVLRDRREEIAHIDFPLRTSDGFFVYADRRIKPERRIRNIAVSEHCMRNSDFIKMFKRYQ